MEIAKITLRSGVKVPSLSLGTWKSPDGEPMAAIVRSAAALGYRAIDTAANYKNERGIGLGVRTSGLPREDFYVSTKIWNHEQGFQEALAAFEKSMTRLDIGYIDQLLIHWPCPGLDRYVDTWRALESLYGTGKVKTVGVSNFTIRHLERLRMECDLVPFVNQIEMHPYLIDWELLAYCQAQGIQVEAYSPLMRGGEVLGDPTVRALAEKHGRSPAQIILRFLLQLGVRVIAKSTHEERMKENRDVFDFTLDEQDMAFMKALNRGQCCYDHPELYNFNEPRDY